MMSPNELPQFQINKQRCLEALEQVISQQFDFESIVKQTIELYPPSSNTGSIKSFYDVATKTTWEIDWIISFYTILAPIYGVSFFVNGFFKPGYTRCPYCIVGYEQNIHNLHAAVTYLQDYVRTHVKNSFSKLRRDLTKHTRVEITDQIDISLAQAVQTMQQSWIKFITENPDHTIHNPMKLLQKTVQLKTDIKLDKTKKDQTIAYLADIYAERYGIVKHWRLYYDDFARICIKILQQHREQNYIEIPICENIYKHIGNNPIKLEKPFKAPVTKKTTTTLQTNSQIL